MWDALADDAARIRRALEAGGVGRDFGTAGRVPASLTAGNSEHARVLDPVPLVVGADEWTRLGRALEQRANVLELVLDDLFGPQRLLAGGHLPTLAVLTHREYLRACVGIASPGAHRLILYASDVARSTDGDLTVLADRTQMPSGIGHTVQNREVMARVQPEALHAGGVLAFEDWLNTCRAALGALAPDGVDQPRIVMMSHGSSVRSHTEHAYLARTTGFTLVEPSDLTVRNARVWLKSVSGLEPVHVILRLVPSRDCDPLELCNIGSDDSVRGIAGLVEACRRQNVAVANPLGSGVGECAALLPFIPRLTRTLLGEDPLIDSAPTWWCGEPAGLSHVLANLDSLLIRSRDAVHGRHTRFGRLMSSDELDELARQIAADPYQFVGQSEVDIATSPGFDGTRIVQRPAITRAFLIRDHDGYRCMQGGLTLTHDRPETITFSTHVVSKDTWVTAPVGGDTTTRWTDELAFDTVPLAPVDLRGSITSRAADSMYWFGRNLERAHATIRLVRAVGLMNETRHDLRSLDDDVTWAWTVDRLVTALVGVGSTPPEVATRLGTAELLTAAITDGDRFRSLTTSLHFLLQNAASVRELFSADSWRLLGQVSAHHIAMGEADAEGATEEATAAVTPLLALSGVVGDSMVRDPGWRFLDIGRRIEAAILVATTLGAALVDDPPSHLRSPFLEAVLNTWDGLVAYRRRYRSDIDPALLIDLLMTDDSNPRSVSSQLTALLDNLNWLPGAEQLRSDLLATADSAVAICEHADPAVLASVDPSGRRSALGVATDDLIARLVELADQIHLAYFLQLPLRSMDEELVAEIEAT